MQLENSVKLGYGQVHENAGSQRVSFAGLYVFTFLLYTRPQELFTAVFGDFPLVKIVAIVALATYVTGRIVSGRPVTIWPIELKMLLLIVVLGLGFAFVAQSPGDSFNVLTDTLLKIVAVFILMINLIDTRQRLLSIIRLVVVVCAFMGLAALLTFAAGRFTPKTYPPRIQGIVNGIFGNPNDLASSLDLAIPLALAAGMWSKGTKRLFYFGCAFILAAAVVFTYSRGGFLGMIAIAIFFMMKLARRKAGTIVLIAVSVVALLMFAPGGYGSRLSSILHVDEDQTGSAQARLDLLTRATEMVVTHPIVGLGLGNFHIYSIAEQRAHNSYLEIAAELGLVGLVAYLIILFAPFRYLRKIEAMSRPTSQPQTNGWEKRAGPPSLDQYESGRITTYYLCLGIQGALIAYAVVSFFGSVQYIWDLYYVVAYAIALKGICGLAAVHTEPDNATAFDRKYNRTSARGSVRPPVPEPPCETGVLWGRSLGQGIALPPGRAL